MRSPSSGSAAPRATTWSSVANTPTVHNVVVCTLCSCYPWPVLGLPPTWYKSPPYRARVVAEPRAVLREFGLELRDEVEIRVWDSSAEVRYLVAADAARRARMAERGDLAALVTRDCMIGTAVPSARRRRRVSPTRARLATVDPRSPGVTPLPRNNGELVFEEPWQGRALGMGVVVLERTGRAGRSSGGTWSLRSRPRPR